MLFQEPAVHCTGLWKKPGESCGMEKIEEIESRNNKAEKLLEIPGRFVSPEKQNLSS